MKVSSLVALAAKQVLDADPGLLGVRLSPIALSKEEILGIAQDAQEVLGEALFLVASAPGVAYKKTARTCLAPDQRAAEQATAWRNTVSVARGEHLLYVSVDDHEKASGLKDCLIQLTEADLQVAFRRWAEDAGNGMPKGLAEALEESGLLDRLPATSLCEFARLVVKDGARGGGWEAAGKHLPVLGLMRDSRLTKADAVERLSANERLVRQVVTAEGRRTTASGPLAELMAALRQALDAADPAEPARALGKIDLGEVKTSQVAVAKPKPKPVAKPAPKPKPAAGAPPKRGGRGGKGEEEEEEVRDGSDSPRPVGPGGSKPGKGTSKTDAARPLAPAGPPLPAGVERMLAELLASEGFPLEWELSSGGRRAFSKLSEAVQPARLDVTTGLPPALREALSAWSEARRALVNLAAFGRSTPASIVRTLAAPQKLFEDERVSAATQALLRVSADLYQRARTLPEARPIRALLTLETVAVRDAEGVMLRLLGPLHPLWLAQAYARFTGRQAEPGLEEVARQLLAHSQRTSPVAPEFWPEAEGVTLSLSSPEEGLVVYERTPEAVAGAPLMELGQRLLRRYLALCPHAYLGVRVAVSGGDAGPLVEGFARHAEADPLLERLEVFCTEAVSPPLSSPIHALVASGRLRLRALPVNPGRLWDEVRPHLVLRLAGQAERPQDEEAAAPAVPTFAAAGGLLSTEFEVRERGLRSRIALSGLPTLDAFEGAHSRCFGRGPRHAFTADSTALSLGSVLALEGASPAVWHVAVGPRFGQRLPTEDSYLLVQERVGEHASCVVVSRDMRAAGRALVEGLKRIDVKEERPLRLRALAAQLAKAHSGGLVSLERTGEHLVAAGVLAMELKRRAAGIPQVLAPVDGGHYAALVGEAADQDEMGALLVGCVLRESALQFQLGYATLDPKSSVEIKNGQLAGGVGARLARVLAILDLAAGGRGLGGAVARETLNWLLWPALAVGEGHDPQLQSALRSWKVGPTPAEVVCLLPQPLVTGKVQKLGKVPAAVLSLDTDLFNRLVLSGAS